MIMSGTSAVTPSPRAPRLETPSVSYIAGSGSTVASAQIYIPAKAEQKGTVEDFEELRREYPEVVSLATKLASGMQLYKSDILILREVAEAMGWDENDVEEELKNLAANPSKRAEKYMELFQKYYSEAHRLLKQGDYPQAATVGSRNSPHQATRRPHKPPRATASCTTTSQRKTQTSLPRPA